MSRIGNNVSEQASVNALVHCKSALSLLNSAEFINTVEGFSVRLPEDSSVVEGFLKKYFSEDEYVDIWRIPHLMIDVCNGSSFFRKAIENDEFRSHFHQFLTELYDYCFEAYRPKLARLDGARGSAASIEASRERLNTLMWTFNRVFENLECNYSK